MIFKRLNLTATLITTIYLLLSPVLDGAITILSIDRNLWMK